MLTDVWADMSNLRKQTLPLLQLHFSERKPWYWSFHRRVQSKKASSSRTRLRRPQETWWWSDQEVAQNPRPTKTLQMSPETRTSLLHRPAREGKAHLHRIRRLQKREPRHQSTSPFPQPGRQNPCDRLHPENPQSAEVSATTTNLMPNHQRPHGQKTRRPRPRRRRLRPGRSHPP